MNLHPFELSLLYNNFILNDGNLSLNKNAILDLILSKDTIWESLIINRRKPHTVRIFTYVDNIRVCLHKFYPCNSDEAFAHPHPWPAKFFIISGGYLMDLSRSDDRFSEPEESTYEHINLKKGSEYTMLNPLTWHRISPTTNFNFLDAGAPTYTIMLNGEPFSQDVVHTQVRTTVGKDLERLNENEISKILRIFISLLS